MTAFEKIYQKVAVTANYLQPTYPRMDNWAVDRWELAAGPGTFFAGMTDAGYRRYIGYSQAGRVVWRVDESYGPQGTVYAFDHTSQAAIDAIDISNLTQYSI